MSREMTQKRRLIGKAHSTDVFAVLVDLQNHLNQVVNVALRVDTAWNRQTNEIHLCCRKHKGSNFNRTDSALEVKFRGKSYTRKLIGGDVRHESARINIDGVPTRRLNDWHSSFRDLIAEVRG